VNGSISFRFLSVDESNIVAAVAVVVVVVVVVSNVYRLACTPSFKFLSPWI
jgi:hypothetical protein